VSTLLIGMPGWQELIIILVIVVIIFGGTRLAGLGKASGRAIREFKDEIKGSDTDKDQASDAQAQAVNPASSAPAANSTPAAPADTTPEPGKTDPR